jgi:HSP20 family molecular chaperone IbpA
MAGGTRDWMWAEALELLDQAERVNRAMFRPGPGRSAAGRRGPACWEPPVDLLETEGELWIQVALPGVPLDLLEVSIEGEALVVAGERPLPLPPGGAGVIRRLETPHGRFERRITLPPGSYELRRRDLALGCLTITLRKLA